MTRAQKAMSHHNRTMPYPRHSPEIPSIRSNQQDYSSASSDRVSVAWSTEDDNRLMQLRTQGMNWGPIASNFHGKTANACRKRHERLMEKKNAESWDEGIKNEDLSRAYLEVREQMWKILADLLGEKWQTVEAKCMEKGLKTLTTAGRAALRHDLTRQTTPPISQRSESEFDESGLCLPTEHSPSSSHHVQASLLPQQHLSAYSYANTLPLQRQASISSNGSIHNNSVQTAMTMAQVMPVQAYCYAPSQQHIYTTSQDDSSSYMSTGFGSGISSHGLANYHPLIHLQPQNHQHYEQAQVHGMSPSPIPTLPTTTSLLPISNPSPPLASY